MRKGLPAFLYLDGKLVSQSSFHQSPNIASPLYFGIIIIFLFIYFLKFVNFQYLGNNACVNNYSYRKPNLMLLDEYRVYDTPVSPECLYYYPCCMLLFLYYSYYHYRLYINNTTILYS